jgi:putative hydrolase of the HAD superfamily
LLRDPSQIRAVLFDAVGTVMYPCPAVGEVYARVGRRWGIQADAGEIDRRFREAFRRQEVLDREAGQRTDEGRERRRWLDIVREVFAAEGPAAGAFDELWDHFARPDAWACFPDVAGCLEALHARGLRLGIASNFDRRLRGVVAGLPALRRCEYLAISSELGWRKPAPGFFAEAERLVGCRPEEILLVGDDRGNDYDGGRGAGWQVLFLDRRGTAGQLRSLDELPRHLAPPAGPA